MRLLAERISGDLGPRPIDRPGLIAGGFALAGQPLENLDQAVAVGIASAQYPIVVGAGEQLAARQRHRVRLLTGCDQRLEGKRIHPHVRLAGQSQVVAAREHDHRRGAKRTSQ